jgi:CRISPR-associated protein Csx3
VAKPVFGTSDHVPDVRLVKLDIPGKVTTPAEFVEAVKEIAPRLVGPRRVYLSGIGPIWGYGMLVHAAHATPAVAIYDPRLPGYVVVETHVAGLELGQILRDPAPDWTET